MIISPHDASPLTPLALWAGFECTLNRVRDRQHDQLAFAGHYGRLEDIDRIAALGIRTLRYPVLWERLDGAAPDDERWAWSDAVLQRMCDVGIDPIIGLVHHGSGPKHTNLLDKQFADGLAAFAPTVAARYPWVTRFTPVNEPLTTARFSALYGVWYPHRRSADAFFRATLHQIRAIRLAMAAIRTITPGAMLVQTEDLGQTHATAKLQYQADFENARRWLTLDLLTLRFGRGHALYNFAREVGVTHREIENAVGDGCVPDIVGINHYATSERWLDERLDRYPAHAHGRNGRHRYADVEAVRALPRGGVGPASLLMQTWQRYGLPMAVTEAHLGCTREQQMRWLHEVWHAARHVRQAGADLQAVTVWAALGTFDWSSLVTRLDGDYEAGLFDVRAPSPRPTALATMAHALATRGEYDHPLLAASGWWHAPQRLTYAVDDHTVAAPLPRTQPVHRIAESRAPRDRPILITGAGGTLGRALVRLCAERGLRVLAITRRELDITDERAASTLLRDSGAWAVVNAAGYVRVDDAERDAARCHEGNVVGAHALACASAERGVAYATFSSDLVFDGRTLRPYVESDVPMPLGVYGATKAEAERRVLDVLSSALVVRTAAFFGPWDEWNFVTRTLASIAEGLPVEAADDLIVSPTYVLDLVHNTLDLLIDGAGGRWHLTNAGAVSWAELGRMAAATAGLDASLVHGRPHAELGLTAARPTFAALGSERASLMPTLEHALDRYVRLRPWQHALLPEPMRTSTHDLAAHGVPLD